jgi:hypothetical protein
MKTFSKFRSPLARGASVVVESDLRKLLENGKTYANSFNRLLIRGCMFGMKNITEFRFQDFRAMRSRGGQETDMLKK